MVYSFSSQVSSVVQRLHFSLWSRFSFIEPLQSEKTEGPWAFRQSDPTETEVYFTEVDGCYSPKSIYV